MATLEEKKRELARLLHSRELAESIFQAAAQKEEQAIEMGLKYKERKVAAAPFADAPAYNLPAGTGIGDVMRG